MKAGWSSTILPVRGEQICVGLFGSASSNDDDETADDDDCESENLRREGASVVCKTPESRSGKAFKEMEDKDRVCFKVVDESVGDSVRWNIVTGCRRTPAVEIEGTADCGPGSVDLGGLWSPSTWRGFATVIPSSMISCTFLSNHIVSMDLEGQS